MRSALLVGAGGQDGRLLAHTLEERGVRVHGLTHTPLITSAPWEPVAADVTDPVAVARLLHALRPDEIYYLAAFHRSAEDAVGLSTAGELRRSLEVHVGGLLNFLEGMQAHCSQSRLFYAASSHVFGTAAGPQQDEITPFAPDSPYGLTKAAGVECCRLFRRRERLYAAAGILFNHESPLRQASYLSQKIVRGAWRAKQHPTSTLALGNLAARVDWGYAPDHVDAMTRILQLPEPADFIIATGEVHSVAEFAEHAFAVLDLDWRQHVREDAGLLKKPSQPLCGNASRLRAATGWAPSVSFSEMVSLLVHAARPTDHIP